MGNTNTTISKANASHSSSKPETRASLLSSAAPLQKGALQEQLEQENDLNEISRVVSDLKVISLQTAEELVFHVSL